MKTKIFVFFMIFVFPYLLQAQKIKLELYEENGLFGYKDQNEQIVILAKYPAAMEFSGEGIAAVADSSGWAFIDIRGNILVRPFIYDNGPDYYSEGLARFVKDGKIGFFDDSGNIVIEAQWDFAYPFNNGQAAVCKGCKMPADDEHKKISGGEWGYIDKTGKVMIPIGSVKVDSVIYKSKKN